MEDECEANCSGFMLSNRVGSGQLRNSRGPHFQSQHGKFNRIDASILQVPAGWLLSPGNTTRSQTFLVSRSWKSFKFHQLLFVVMPRFLASFAMYEEIYASRNKGTYFEEVGESIEAPFFL